MELHGAEALKREAARKAFEQVGSGMSLGLGTGSTVAHFLDLLGEALQDDSLTDIVGVATSIRTEREARQVGITLALTTLACPLKLRCWRTVVNPV